nr:transposase [Escherichia coli]
MSRKTQRYSKEFKAEAVRTVLENQLSISEGEPPRFSWRVFYL